MKLMNSSSIRVARFGFSVPGLVMHCLILCFMGSVIVFADAHPRARVASSGRLQIKAAQNQDVANRPVPPSDEPRVRIRLRSKALDSTLVFGESGQRLLCFHRPDSRLILRPAPLQITHLDDGWRLVDGDMRTTLLAGSGVLSIRTLVDHPSNIFFEDGALPGFVDLVPLKSFAESSNPDRLDVIVSVPLETYLPGVLDVELYGHWPFETFQAQAVAARSFALAEAAFWRTRRHFDLIAGPESQGWSGDQGSSRAREAVLGTTGMVLVHEGRVIPAYYSASCGGLPASADDAISSRDSHRIKPLVPMNPRPSGCCSESSVYEWQVEFKRNAVERSVRIWLRERGEDSELLESSGASLQKMITLERSPTGRPLAYALIDSTGTSLRIEAESFRRLLSTLPRANKEEAEPLRSSAFSGEFRGRRFLVEGLGWGHGCGLCQYGANAMGKRGATWREMIELYYPGSDVRVCWGPQSEDETLSKAGTNQ